LKIVLKIAIIYLLCIMQNNFLAKDIKDDSLFISSKFTPNNSFTSGAEGPAVDKEGNIYAVNYNHQGTIGIVTPKGKASLFVELPSGSVGNGIRFNSKGEMFIADYKKHNILKVNMETKKIEVFAHDNRMNQPNDIAIADNDVIYASDPNWSNSTGNLWMIDTNGTTHLLESGMSTTNGVEVSPDNKTLYVGESNSHRIWAYDILPNDSISNKRLVKKFFDGSVLDGIRTDSLGNLYVACHNKKRITILSPDGEVINEVATIGSNPTNIAFGGVDGKTCYITIAGNGNIETFRTDTPGRSWVMLNNPTDVKHEQSSNIPNEFRIEQNYPNPFNPSTNIKFNLPNSSNVKIIIYDTLGREVIKLADREFESGEHTLTWNINETHGKSLTSGIYFANVQVGTLTKSIKMLLMK
jgi:sugar lactone lactonase YvrE